MTFRNCRESRLQAAILVRTWRLLLAKGMLAHISKLIICALDRVIVLLPNLLEEYGSIIHLAQIIFVDDAVLRDKEVSEKPLDEPRDCDTTLASSASQDLG